MSEDDLDEEKRSSRDILESIEGTLEHYLNSSNRSKCIHEQRMSELENEVLLLKREIELLK